LAVDDHINDRINDQIHPVDILRRELDDLKHDLAALRIERKPVRRNWGRWIGWVVVLLILAGVGAGARAWLTRERSVSVQVASVTERAAGTQAAVLNASGYVTARRRATVSSKITGKVVEVNIEEGKAVSEGQVLARLDDSNAHAALMLLEARLSAGTRPLLCPSSMMGSVSPGSVVPSPATSVPSCVPSMKPQP